MTRLQETVSVKDAVFKLQNFLLEGIRTEDQLLAAGSIIARGDYEDVVTERSIANLCGYPLCANALPSDRPRKGRYRISLKEHKVYDLYETYMYCSSNCVVNSRAFGGSLQNERCSVFDSRKIEGVLRLFGNAEEGRVDKVGDLGLSRLQIKENEEIKGGEVSLDEWVGPSTAIEGYIPQKRESKATTSRSKNRGEGEGSKSRTAKPSKQNLIINDVDFMSTVITQDEYSVSKLPTSSKKEVSTSKVKQSKGKAICKDSQDVSTIHETSLAPKQKVNEILEELTGNGNTNFGEDKNCSQMVPLGDDIYQRESDRHGTKAEKACRVVDTEKNSAQTKLKPSLKSKGAKKVNRSVTWADEKVCVANGGKLCEFREMEDTKEYPSTNGVTNGEDDENLLRFSSAEACAETLSQAAETVTSTESDACDAMSEAGLIILPCLHDADEDELVENFDVSEIDTDSVKWPRKPGVPSYDVFNAEDSWFDSPPEGFSLTLSPFATMWGALFAWITSSTLAYIYGKDDSFHEEYQLVNGREYPRKIVLPDGRSAEIRQTLAGCLSRALPGLVSDLRLPTPISILEQGMGHLLDTMSFADALPAFRTKQWEVIVLLLIDVLSVSRVPALTMHMTNRHPALQKVLHGAQMSIEEYEILKDLLIPMGRAPQFSSQNGA